MADFYWHLPTHLVSWPDSVESGRPCQAEPFGAGREVTRIDAAAKHSGKGADASPDR